MGPRLPHALPDRLPCEFFLIRYVPDVVKGEFVNIGVLLREAAGSGRARAEGGTRHSVRFTRDWARVRCMDAEADVALLESLEAEIAARLAGGVSALDPKPVLAVLEDSLSNSVQMSEPRATLAENMASEMEQLMRLYVEPLKSPRTRKESPRATLNRTLRTEFERAGVWGLMRKRIAAATYTRAGDPLKLDCGYRAQGSGAAVKIFHAVSLDGDVEAAKVLAYSAPQLREGVARVEAATLELTAVVEPLRSVSNLEDEASERYAFGVDTMERSAIRVITANDLARAAATARQELGL